MKTVHKYLLEPDEDGKSDVAVVVMPKNAIMLRVGFQADVLCLWAQIDTAEELSDEERLVERKFAIVPTGREVPENSVYVGTAEMDVSFSTFVYHVFEVLDQWRHSPVTLDLP